jgi:hypothetical protein
MEANQRSRIAGGLAGFAAGLSPMNSFTFVLALAVTVLAGWGWLNHSGDPRPPFPLYGAIAASYAVGFLIGRVFRSVLKVAAIIAAILLGGLALLNRAHVETSQAKQAVQAGSTWLQAEASRAKACLLHFLPSAGAAGVGVFAGGRRRRVSGETPTYS